MADFHPGSFVGDSVEEFKKLPTWAKIAVPVVFVVVIYFLVKRGGISVPTSATASPTSSAAGNVPGTQSPFPTVNGLPLLPSNVNPVFDSAGNPVAFQQAPNAPANNPGQTSNPAPTPAPTPVKPVGVTPPAPKPALPASPVINASKPLTLNTKTTMNTPASTTPHVTSAVPQPKPPIVYSPGSYNVSNQSVHVQAPVVQNQPASQGARFF